MTKKLESLFNLPEMVSEPTAEESQTVIEENKEVITAVNTAIDKIDAALPMVRDLETGDDELDELAKLATDKFQDLMDLGMNVDARFSGTILQTAGTLLGHAITAKTAKMDKKLRMIQLQLAKERLELQKEQANKKQLAEDPIEGQGVVLDRNALLQQILNRPTEQNNTK
jgi:hypothetical protein